MGGLSRKASERAAKAVVGFNEQVPISVGGLGSIGYNGLSPVMNLDPWSARQMGMFGYMSADAGRQARAGMPMAGQTSRQMFGASQGLLRSLGSFDPLQQAQTRFNRLQSVLEPQRERARSGLESRLLAQGRLDSSGGALQMGEQEQAIAAQDAQMLDQMYSEAQQAQQAQAQMAQQLGQQGASMMGGLASTAIQQEQARQGEYNPLFQLLSASQTLRQNEINRLVAGSNALQGHNATMGGGGGGLGGALGSLAGGFLGSMASPLGTAAGTALGGNLFGSGGGS